MSDLDFEPMPMTVDNGQDHAEPIVPPGTMAVQMVNTDLTIRRAALALPRQMGTVKRHIDQSAELSGDAWEYRFPVKSKGETKWITGASIKCAQAIARAYGNCAATVSRVEDIGDSWMIYSTFVDFESNYQLTRGFRQRKSQKTMRTDAARSEDIVFQIGTSKSMRNAICNALGDLVDYALDQARNRLTQQVTQQRDQFVDKIKRYVENAGYPLAKIEAFYNAKIAKWDAATVAQVYKTLLAHRDGVLPTLKEAFEVESDIADAPAPVDLDASGIKAAPEPQEAPSEAGDDIVGTDTGEVTEVAPEPATGQHGIVHEQEGFKLEQFNEDDMNRAMWISAQLPRVRAVKRVNELSDMAVKIKGKIPDAQYTALVNAIQAKMDEIREAEKAA